MYFFVLVNGLQVQYANIAAPRSANVILNLTGQSKKCTKHTNKIVKSVIVVFGCFKFTFISKRADVIIRKSHFRNKYFIIFLKRVPREGLRKKPNDYGFARLQLSCDHGHAHA